MIILNAWSLEGLGGVGENRDEPRHTCDLDSCARCGFRSSILVYLICVYIFAQIKPSVISVALIFIFSHSLTLFLSIVLFNHQGILGPKTFLIF